MSFTLRHTVSITLSAHSLSHILRHFSSLSLIFVIYSLQLTLFCCSLFDTHPTPGHLSTGAPNVQLPEFVLPDNITLSSSEATIDEAHAFLQLYRQHCQQLVDSVWKHHFAEVEKLFRLFWQVRQHSLSR